MADCTETHPETGQECVRQAPHEEHLTSLARDVYCQSWFTGEELDLDYDYVGPDEWGTYPEDD